MGTEGGPGEHVSVQANADDLHSEVHVAAPADHLGGPDQPSADSGLTKRCRLPFAARALLWLTLAVGYAALMWYIVFPWVDRHFVSRPTL